MFEVYDPLGRCVRCTDEQWTEHVVDGHPEMNGHERHVAEAIERAHLIAKSGQHLHRNVYYAATQKSWRLSEAYLRIVVEFEWKSGGIEGDGTLISAFPVSGRKANEGQILWPKN